MAKSKNAVKFSIRCSEDEYKIIKKKMEEAKYKKMCRFIINSAVKSKIINIDILPLLDIVEKLSAINNEIKFSDDTELSLKSPS